MDGDFVRLKTFDTEMEAEICVSMLRTYGIHAYFPAGFIDFTGNPRARGTGVPVMVHKSDVGDALALLADVRRNGDALEPGGNA